MMSIEKASEWLKSSLEKAEASQFYNPAQIEHIQQIAKKYFQAVCQIRTQDKKKKGTGCLIEGGLVITNHHVIDSIETAKKSHAVFFRVESQATDKSKTTTMTEKVHLDPNRYFFTSPNNVSSGGDIQKVDSGHLDFTIVSLDLNSSFQIPSDIFSVFQRNVFLQEKAPVSVIQHPDVIYSTTGIKGDINWTIGLIQKLEDYSIHYNAATAPGYSGGAIIDSQGELIALHYQSFPCNCNTNKRCNSGVSISRIRDCLKNAYDTEISQEQKIQKLIDDEKVYKTTKLEDLLCEHLKKNYCSQAEIETLIEKRTLSIEDIYVRLALIKEEENKEVKGQKIPEDGRMPTYETLYDPKEFIELEKLFQNEELKQSQAKRMLLFGAAGVGKTTCIHQIAHEWANGRLWNEFKAVFWICLRNLNLEYYPPREKDYDAYDLISKECKILSKESGLDLSTFRFLMEKEEFRNYTLLVLDGYDELPPIAYKGYLSDAFQQLKKIFPHILISSRPQSVSFIKNPVKMEILGFDRKGVDQYIEKFHKQISKTSELPKKKLEQSLESLRSLLAEKPLLHSLSCIPINLELLCCLYFFDEQVNSNALTTITSLYSSIINWLCKRFLLRHEITQDSAADICELKNICDHSKISPLMSILKEVAWYAMDKNMLYFPSNKIKADSFNSIRSLGLLKVKNKMVNFLHLTFQEYFAAAYLANYYIEGKSNDVKKNIAKNKLIPRYALVFEMTAGYLSSLDDEKALQKFFDDLLSEPYDLAVNYELNLLARCFEECQNPSIITQYPKFIEFAADYIQNNWIISSHSIAQLLKYNPRLLYQEKTSQVILEILNKGEEIVLSKQDNQKLSEFAKDITTNSTSLNNIKIVHVRTEVIRFLVEIAQVSQELCIKVINIFIKALNNSNHREIRKSAASALGNILQSYKFSKDTIMTLVNALINGLNDADENVQINAVEALGKLSQYNKVSENIIKIVTQVLSEFLIKTSVFVRTEATNALCDIMQSKHVLSETITNVANFLIKSLNNKESAGRIAANKVLGKIILSKSISSETLNDVIAALVKTLGDSDNNIRKSAFFALSEMKVTEVIAALNATMGYFDKYARRHAIEALVNIGLSDKASEDTKKNIIIVLKKALDDTSEDVRRHAINALVDVGISDKVSENIAKNIVIVLTSALDNTNEDIHRHAIEALGNIGRSNKVSEDTAQNIVITFTKFLNNKDENVRRNAIEALVNIGRSDKVSEDTAQNIVMILTKALKDTSEDVRRQSINALVDIGNSDKVSEDTAQNIVMILTKAPKRYK